jgi:hypothetical protein
MAIATAPHEGGTDDRLSGLMEAAGTQVDELDTEGQAPAAPVAEPPSAVPAEPPAATEGEPPSPPAAATPPATSEARKPYDDFLAKHGGDPEKGAQHYFDVMGQNSRLARERDDLAARLKAVEEAQARRPQPQEVASPPPVAETPPEIQELDNQVRVLSSNFGVVEQQLAGAQVETNRWGAHLEGLLNQLERAGVDPSIDENALRRAIADARQNLRGWQDFSGNLWRTRGSLVNEFRQVQREKAHWDRVLALERTRTQDEDVFFEQQVGDFRREWDQARQSASQKIPEKHRERFMSWAEKMGTAEVNTWDAALGDTKQIDPGPFAEHLAQEYIDWLRHASTDYAAAKVASATVAAPVGKRAVVPGEAPRKRAQSLEELQAQHDAAWAAERI